MKKEQKTELLLFPTDTVPGIGCLLSDDCVKKLRNIKKRPEDKPFPILLPDKKDIKKYVKEIPPIYGKLKKILPGGLTLIFKGKKNLPKGVLSKEGKVGIRIPDHKELREFIRKSGTALIATSANISGEGTPKELKDVDLTVDKILEGDSGSGKASTVVDISNNSLFIYRKGAIPILEIEKTTGKEVKISKNVEFNVLFVCSANMCRSPIAEIHLKYLIRDLKQVNVHSAGICAMTGASIYKLAREVLIEENLNAEHTSILLTKPIIEWADLILVMEPIHKKYISFLSAGNKSKIEFLSNFKTKNKQNIIDDPAGKDLKTCRKTFQIIKKSNKRVDKYLRNKI
jgi:L-threonylcarbamoyladenylate synthase